MATLKIVMLLFTASILLVLVGSSAPPPPNQRQPPPAIAFKPSLQDASRIPGADNDNAEEPQSQSRFEAQVAELTASPVLRNTGENIVTATSNNNNPKRPSSSWSSSESDDGSSLDPVVASASANGDVEDDSGLQSRHRRIVVVYPHFDFVDEHHEDNDNGYGYGHKKASGGYGGGGGYGSSTHYHPDPHPTKYGYGGKKYGGYRRLRGPLSPILNWYYFGYL